MCQQKEAYIKLQIIYVTILVLKATVGSEASEHWYMHTYNTTVILLLVFCVV